MPENKEVKAFSFLDRDPRQVADEMRRVGWTWKQLTDLTAQAREWTIGIENAFCAAEEANRGDE